MSDLIRGRYPVGNPLVKLAGGLANVVQGNLAARTNGDWPIAAITDEASLTTAVALTVAIPVEPGDEISAINYLVGATAGATMANQWAALYSGAATPALLGQSVDTTSAAITASTALTYDLATPVVITRAIAPNGYVFASVMVKASTPPSLLGYTCAVAAQYAWFANSPSLFAATHGSALTATAPSTIASPSKVANVPLVFLT